MKLPRKLKKKIIKMFGRGTYTGIITGYLNLKHYRNNTGIITERTDKKDKFFSDHQFNPYINMKLL